MLIVALDVFSFEEMVSIVTATQQEVDTYKIGHQLFTAEGPRVIQYLKALGKQVFLDLKLHEIANSVASAVTSAGRHGVDMVTVHASGGRTMMESAVTAAKPFANLKIIALTVVTGLNDNDLLDIGVTRTTDEQVSRLAQLAESSGCHGVIASPQETALLRAALSNNTMIITPGIRPIEDKNHDQKRVGTPAHAIQNGASYIIVGRPIIQATSPEIAAANINRQISKAKTH